MTCTLFAEMCRDAAAMLEATAKQCDASGSLELQFDMRNDVLHIKPLAEIIVAICAAAK